MIVIVFHKFEKLKLPLTLTVSLIVLTSPSTVHLPPLRCDNLEADVITSFLVLALIYFPLSSAVDLFAQQRGNISVTQATALPLVNAEGIDSYQQGSADKRAAGIADYPNNDNDCPSGHSTAYCAGWSGGYRTGFNAQRTLDESGRHSGNGDNNDDDEN